MLHDVIALEDAGIREIGIAFAIRSPSLMKPFLRTSFAGPMDACTVAVVGTWKSRAYARSKLPELRSLHCQTSGSMTLLGLAITPRPFTYTCCTYK